MKKSAGDFEFVYKEQKFRRSPTKLINNLDFADDIALLEKSHEMANKQLTALSSEAKKVGLEINIEKTKYMTFKLSEDDITLNDKKLEEVKDFQYIGSRMISSFEDFKRRKALAWTSFWDLNKIWQAKHVPTKLKINIFIASVLSVLLYGCETWIIITTTWRKRSTVFLLAAMESC
jgi:hypothetical protein